MKPLLVVYCACMLLLSCNKTVPATHLHKGISEKDIVLKKHIKSISIYLIYPPDSIKREQYFSYDRHGNTKESIYNTFKDKYLFFYDSNGRRISQVSFHGDNIPDTSVFIYDKQGAYIVKTKNYIEKYDSAGRELESMDGFRKTTYNYDMRGNLLRESSVPLNEGSFGGSDKNFKYDSLGNLIEEINAVSGIDLSENKEIYKYDNDGRNIECDVYGYTYGNNNPWHLDNVSYRTYNDLGQRIRIKNMDGNGKLKSIATSFYNSDSTDNMTFYYNNKGAITSEKVYVYEYYK